MDRKKRKTAERSCIRHRSLRLELLESRELLSADSDVLAFQASQYSDESTVIVTTLQDVVNESDGLISLREAVRYAQSNATIGFAVQGTIQLDHTNDTTAGCGILVDKSLYLDATSGTITLDGMSTGRIFTFQRSSDDEISITLENIHFVNGYSSDDGGAVSVGYQTHVVLTDSSIRSCQASNGGAFLVSGTLELDGVSVSGCKATGNGGVFSVATFGILEVHNSTCQNNTASGYGGVLSVSSASETRSVLFRECVFSENTAGQGGGGLYLESGKLELFDVLLSANTTAKNGGGIYGAAGILQITGGELSGNEAVYGGGIYLATGAPRASIYVTTLSNNIATESGGAIYNGGALQLAGSVVTGNESAGLGGGLYNSYWLEVADCELTENTTTRGYGGAIASEGNNALLLVEDSLLKGNTAPSDSGGAISTGGVCQIVSCSLLSNVALSYGGAIDNRVSGTLTVSASVLAGNRLTTTANDGGKGGGIYSSVGTTLSLIKTTVYGNYSKNAGSGIYNSGTASLTNSFILHNTDAIAAGFSQNPNSGSYTRTNTEISDNQSSLPDLNESIVLYDEQGNSVSDIPDLGHIVAGETGSVQTFTLKNAGTSTLTLSAPTAGGQNTSAFVATGSAMTEVTLSPGETVSFTVAQNSSAASETNFLSLSWQTGDQQFLFQCSYTLGNQAATLSDSSVSLAANSTATYTITPDRTLGSGETLTVLLVADEGITLSETVIVFTESLSQSHTITVKADQAWLTEHEGTTSLRISYHVVSELDHTRAVGVSSLIGSSLIAVEPYSVIDPWEAVPGGVCLVRSYTPCVSVTQYLYPEQGTILRVSVDLRSFMSLSVSKWRIGWGDGITQTLSWCSSHVSIVHAYQTTGAMELTLSWYDATLEQWSQSCYAGRVFVQSGTTAGEAALPELLADRVLIDWSQDEESVELTAGTSDTDRAIYDSMLLDILQQDLGKQKKRAVSETVREGDI